MIGPLPQGTELVIWDFDGTIIDTEWPAFQAAKVEFERYGASIDIEVWKSTLGSADHEPWWDGLRRQVGRFDESDEELITRYRATKNQITDALQLRPGVRSLFDRFGADEMPCALASSSPLSWVERHTRRHELWDRFVTVATSDDVGTERTKPHPDLFLLAADRARVEPSKCVVIEDSQHGITAAKAAGMYAIATPHRLTVTQDLSHADLIITPDPNE